MRDVSGAVSVRTVPGRATDRAATRVLTLPPGLFGPDQVDVAYDPWLALAATGLHVGPTSRSPVVLSDSGEAVSLGIGQHLGRQTRAIRGAGTCQPYELQERCRASTSGARLPRSEALGDVASSRR